VLNTPLLLLPPEALAVMSIIVGDDELMLNTP